MDIRDFHAGSFISRIQYKSFAPELINLEWIISEPSISTLLEDANLKLGALDTFSSIVPDVTYS